MHLCVVMSMSHIFLIVTDCGELSHPANGQVVLGSTTVGGIATYLCNEGYNLTGSSRLICGSDGAWIGVAPVCGSKCRVGLFYSYIKVSKSNLLQMLCGHYS